MSHSKSKIHLGLNLHKDDFTDSCAVIDQFLCISTCWFCHTPSSNHEHCHRCIHPQCGCKRHLISSPQWLASEDWQSKKMHGKSSIVNPRHFFLHYVSFHFVPLLILLLITSAHYTTSFSFSVWLGQLFFIVKMLGCPVSTWKKQAWSTNYRTCRLWKRFNWNVRLYGVIILSQPLVAFEDGQTEDCHTFQNSSQSYKDGHERFRKEFCTFQNACLSSVSSSCRGLL